MTETATAAQRAVGLLKDAGIEASVWNSGGGVMLARVDLAPDPDEAPYILVSEGEGPVRLPEGIVVDREDDEWTALRGWDVGFYVDYEDEPKLIHIDADIVLPPLVKGLIGGGVASREAALAAQGYDR